MKQAATVCNSTPAQSTNTRRQSRGARFNKVLDGRKQPIRGLWERNGRYYAQLTFEDATTGAKFTKRQPLTLKDGEPVTTVPEAREAMERLKVKRADNSLPILRRTPKFSEFVETYLAHIQGGTTDRMKKDTTIAKEKASLNGWTKVLGKLRVDQIKRAHVNAYVAKRKTEGLSNRTVNLDVIMFRSVMKHAIDEGHIQTLPTQNMRPMKVAQKKRTLFTPADLEKLCKASTSKNGQQFADYVRLLAYSGARRNEALALQWDRDVDFKTGTVDHRRHGRCKEPNGARGGLQQQFESAPGGHAQNAERRIQSGYSLPRSAASKTPRQNIP